MTDNEAMKLALDALELVNIEFVCNGAHHAKKDRHGLDEDCPVTMRYQTAITAIKEALAQPEQEPVPTLEDLEQEIYQNTRNFISRDVMEWMLRRYYTHPPQRKPLTDEQRQELMSKAWNKWLSNKDDGRLFAWDFSFEVEAAHGIKEDT